MKNLCHEIKKGKNILCGLFECDKKYTGFITQGAKKYAYIDCEDNKIHITVAGVPKKGAEALKDLKDFKDDFIFPYEVTNKNMICYNDNMEEIYLTDYQGNTEKLNNKYGSTLLPASYTLGKALDYCELLSDNVNARAKFIENRGDKK